MLMNENKSIVFTSVKDSGERQQFKTGSQRDTDSGKGNPSLVPCDFFKLLLSSYSSDRRNKIKYKFEDINHCYEALEENICDFGKDINTSRAENTEKLINQLLVCFKIAANLMNFTDSQPINESFNPYTYALRRLSVHYQNGAVKYDKNNWRKGQPISRYFDSTKRHLWAYSENKTDEDHLSAVLWNIVAMIITIIDISKGLLPFELFDFPYTFSELSPHYANGQKSES